MNSNRVLQNLKILIFRSFLTHNVGYIMLPIQLGPNTVEVMTYVLDKKLSYDILLKRLWIKFNHDVHNPFLKAIIEFFQAKIVL